MSGRVSGDGALVAAALVVAAILVEVIRRWALHRQILDHPNERSSHSVPTPRGGGIAIVIVTMVGIAAAQYSERLFSLEMFWAITVAALAIAIVSWIDDVYTVSTLLRFTVHLAAAVVTTLASGTWAVISLPGIGVLHVGTMGAVIMILWIVGLTNAYNFMDGIDGIAGIQAVVTGLGWVSLGWITHVQSAAIVGGLIAGSAAGFTLHNWQPARIFMGDVGSAFLGYMFGALTVATAATDPRLEIAGMLLVWPFVFDTLVTFLRRAARHERVFSAHRSHLYQRLNQSGMSHGRVATIYAILACVGVAAAIAVIRHTGVFPAMLSLAIAALGLTATVKVRERRA